MKTDLHQSAVETSLWLVRYYNTIANTNQPILTREEQRLRRIESEVMYLRGMVDDLRSEI